MDQKISDLSNVTSLLATDEFVIRRAAANNSVEPSVVATFVSDSIEANFIQNQIASEQSGAAFWVNDGRVTDSLIVGTTAAQGSVGIGTTSPFGKFEIVGDGSFFPLCTITDYSGGSGANTYFIGRAARGTQSTPTALQSGDELVVFGGRGYGSTGFSTTKGFISFKTTQVWTDANQGVSCEIGLTPTNSTLSVRRFFIDGSGNVGISDSGTPTARLSIVQGGITTDIKNLDGAVTWNNGAVTFKGWQLNVTDTASAAGSLLLDLKIGGSTVYSITKAGTIQLVANGNIELATSGAGTKIGTTTSQLLAFHGSTAVAQRAGAAQASVSTTASTNSSPFGYTTAAQADGIVTLVNELRAVLVEKGLMKGAA